MIYDTVDAIIRSFKQHRHAKDYLGLLSDGLALLEYINPLINLSIEHEAEYRKFEARLSDEKDDNGKRNSGAYCEVQAKATEHYKEWQKARQVIELCYELSSMSKKLAASVDSELKAN